MPLCRACVQTVDHLPLRDTLRHMVPVITPLYAGLLGLFYLGLSFRIPRLRLKYRVGLGDGGIPELQRAIRTHGNFAEYVPMILCLLLLVELAGYSGWFVLGLGLLTLLARGLHAYGLYQSSSTSRGRFAGTVLTFFILLVCSLLLILRFAVS